ncbi:hypothetical protein AMATHDRAFT_11246 [Amanita thiersii Skay4041]|uniref:Uncharacterized protein n=1 Tax=Amanita thiersii Skay4041 TaxID=703135 RepID=A0A2A9NAB9_9AGAR|nr:hypothetical protein AMATHDRAFT_11246 [Amanita thiersii Skay4041]
MATGKPRSQDRGNHNTDAVGGPMRGHHWKLLEAHQSPHQPRPNSRILQMLSPEQELPGVLQPLHTLVKRLSAIKLIIEFIRHNPTAFTFEGLVINEAEDEGVPYVQPTSLQTT